MLETGASKGAKRTLMGYTFKPPNNPFFRVFVLIAMASLLQCCASLFQPSDQALIRGGEHGIFGPGVPVAQEAAKHWEYAWLSEAAYAARAGVEQSRSGCASAEQILGEAHWVRWRGFPDDGLKTSIEKYNLRVEVWEKADPHVVAVAFGGTVFNNRADWKANFRWFSPSKDDEYTVLVRRLGPAFIDEFKRRAAAASGTPKLVSTGHSLGAGLAQQFAYALPRDNLVPRVTQVYAFDPSPVTGFFSVDEGLRDYNARDLSIDRIFERGEVLAIVRSLQSLVLPTAASHPAIREIRYSLFYKTPFDPIGGHSMERLARGLQATLGTGGECS